MENKISKAPIPPPEANIFTTATVRCWKDENGVAIFVANGIQTVESAKENMEIFRRMSNGKKAPVLLEFTNIKTITKEAREYYTSKESSSLVSAVAIVTNSVVGKVIGNFFIGLNFNKSGAPVKMFTDAMEAKKWLNTFLQPAINS